jgi:hypothetical protein
MAKKKNDELKKFNDRLKELILAKDDFVEEYAKSLTGDDGKAHIAVDLEHGAPLFDAFSNRYDLDPSLYEYVENSAKYLRVSMPVVIDFLIDPSKAPLEEKISKEFRGNYRFVFDETRHEIAKCDRMIVWRYIIGIFFIIVTSVLTGLYHRYSGSTGSEYFDIASQITSIASWVFIWDAVDKQAFERRDLKQQTLRAAQLCGAEVHFTLGNASPQQQGGVGK